jgi:hypothetical protein
MFANLWISGLVLGCSVGGKGGGALAWPAGRGSNWQTADHHFCKDFCTLAERGFPRILVAVCVQGKLQGLAGYSEGFTGDVHVGVEV